MFTHYEDMKGDKNCKNWGGLGRSSETSPFESAYIFLFEN